MKVKFDMVFRAYVGVLVALLLWAVWADAQTVTNTNAAAASVVSTNKAGIATTNITSPSSLTVNSNAYYLTFGLDKVESLQPPLWGRPLWQYYAFFIYMLLALGAAKMVDVVFQALLKRWADKTETKYDDLLVELLHGPIKVIAFVIFLHVGLDIFSWPMWVEKYLSKGLKLVVAWSVTFMAVRSVDLLMRYMKERAKGEDRVFDAQLFIVLKKSLKVFIVLVAVLVTAQNLDLNITGILASLSIGGLAIGLAAQDTLANLFGAVAIFADKPFRLGDRVKLDDKEGAVERIGMRSTRIRNDDGHLITIPNKTVGAATIINVTSRPNIRTVMNFGIAYETSTAKVRRAVAVLEEVYRSNPNTADVLVAFNQFGDSTLNIQVIHWWKTGIYKEYLLSMQEMNLTIKQRFEDERIEFAYPTQVHYVKTAIAKEGQKA